MRKIKLPRLKKLLKRIDYKWFVVILLAIALLGQTFYFYKQNQVLQTKLNSEIAKNLETRNQLDTLQDATAYFYKEYQETGEWTWTALTETVYNLTEWQDYIDDFVKTHNENVRANNANFEDIYAKANSLQRQIDILADYLWR